MVSKASAYSSIAACAENMPAHPQAAPWHVSGGARCRFQEEARITAGNSLEERAPIGSV